MQREIKAAGEAQEEARQAILETPFPWIKKTGEKG
jgi:hypothetical protein